MNKFQYRLDRIAAKLSPQKRHIFYNRLKKIPTHQDRFFFVSSMEIKLRLKSVYDTS